MKTQQKNRNLKATIVDVRTPAEFIDGHAEDSINIPLREIPARLDELRPMENIILCCASGSRSAQATAYLKQHGIPCENGGPWTEVNCEC